MYHLILCEGKTDAVILSHIIGKYGFKFNNKEKKIKFKSLKNQSIDCYVKNDETIFIWNVAGCDNFKYSIKEFLDVLKNIEIASLILVCDHDNSNIKDIETKFNSYFKNVNVKNQKIYKYQYETNFQEQKEMNLLLLVIPNDKFGALETLLLEALKTTPENKEFVEKVEKFIDKLKKEKNKFLNKDRKVIKAKLGCSINIMDPERTFKDIIPAFNSIEWEEYEVVQSFFKPLIDYIKITDVVE